MIDTKTHSSKYTRPKKPETLTDSKEKIKSTGLQWVEVACLIEASRRKSLKTV